MFPTSYKCQTYFLILEQAAKALCILVIVNMLEISATPFPNPET